MSVKKKLIFIMLSSILAAMLVACGQEQQAPVVEDVSTGKRVVTEFEELFDELTFDFSTSGTNPKVNPKWQMNVPTKSCTAAGHTQCHRGSPAIADINGDGIDDVIIVTHNGHIVAIKDNGAGGQVIWDKDIAPAFNMAPGQEEINSSPAVADIDGDGKPEIVVGVGGMYPFKHCASGGIIVLEHNGAVKAGWPKISKDELDPKGCPDTIFSSPALADLDLDGDLEIVVAGFDRRIYAFHHNGTAVAGFPVNSVLYDRFGWHNLQARLADTIWSSPAIADLDGDGYPEIIIGTDEGNFDNRYNPTSADNWNCPFAKPPALNPGYCGGTVYAIRGDGQLMPGFPKRFMEIIQSSPVAYDVDQDGRAEIFVGTGSYYHHNSPDHPTGEFRMYGFDGSGNDLPGWEGGKVMDHAASATAVLGDIAGDANPEVIIGTLTGKLYAWHLDGSLVAGYPVTPQTQYGAATKFDVGKSFVLADSNGDGKMEIIFTQEWVVNLVSGASQLTTNNFPNGNLMFNGEGLLLNTPALGDIDGDGELEMIVHNSKLTVWDMPGVTQSDWPMFKQNAAGTSELRLDALRVHQTQIGKLTDAVNTAQTFEIQISNPGDGELSWTASADHPKVSIMNGSGTVSDGIVTITVQVNPLAVGNHDLGNITISTSADVPGQLQTVPLQVSVVNEINSAHLPFLNGANAPANDPNAYP